MTERQRLLLGALFVVVVCAFWGFQTSRRSATAVVETIPEPPKPYVENQPKRNGPRVHYVPPPRQFGLDPDATHPTPIGPGGGFEQPLLPRTPEGQNAEAALRVQAPTMKEEVVMPPDDGSDPRELDKTPVKEGVVQPNDADVTLPQDRPEAQVVSPVENPQ